MYSTPPIYWSPAEQLSQAAADRYEENAGSFWEIFYKGHQNKFFKNRHYLHREFPELAQGPITILEVGCGVGNTVFPLLEANPQLKVYACDFSPTAVELVKHNEQYASGRVSAFVADITADRLADNVPEGSMDVCTMVFVLSAIAPEKMLQAIKNVRQVLKPGSGTVLVRDYARGDLAEQRFTNSSRQQRLGPQFYVRGDGTRAYYFSEGELVNLFKAAGFSCRDVRTHERSIQNRALAVSMDRRWVQAVFTLAGPHDGSQPAAAQPALLPPTSAAALDTASQTAPTSGFGSSSAGAQQPAACSSTDSSFELQGTAQNSTPGAASHRQQIDSVGSETAASSSDVERSSQMDADNPAEVFPQRQDGTEWEDENQLHALDDGLGQLFQAGAGTEAEQIGEDIEISGAGIFRLRSISREHRHTMAHTGLMLWDAAPAFAGWLVASPQLLNRKTVLELGCGANPLCMMAALRHARRVVSTDGSPKALLCMAENISLNASKAIVERARLRQLAWGNQAHMQALKQEYREGFDVILGADIAYVDSFVPDLFATAAALLSPRPEAKVLLCHITRQVSEDKIVAVAKSAGLDLMEIDKMHCSASKTLVEGPTRLLCFARRLS